MNEWIIGLPILGITWFLLERLNPKLCARCSCETFFEKRQHFHNNPNYPIQRYCLKCFFYINLSKWKCDNCGNSGSHRIHELNFISRLLVIKQKKNLYKKCSCGNMVELTQK